MATLSLLHHFRIFRRRSLVLVILAGTLVVSPAATAETNCYTDDCSATCTPSAPVAISPLVEPGDFPAGMDTPIAFVDPADGRGRYLIATQEGAILVWDGVAGAMLPTPFLDLRDNVGGPVLAGGERGLLALAVDPDYSTNGRIYIFYTRAGAGSEEGDVVIARYERSVGNPDVGNGGSATPLLVIDHPASNHNGGSLAFGPDGFLYISTGDGGGGCDGSAGANGDGQRIDTLAGKMLRIDVRGIDGSATAPDNCGVGAGGPYTVPSTNPFAGQGAASCDEVWLLGLRNPFRFSFDRWTGDLYIGDVGQNKWEEINLKAASTPAPVNFGWVCREGCETADNDESNCAVGGCPLDTGTSCLFPRSTGINSINHWDPVLCHYNGGWDSIMGGYRYHGTFVPSLAGDYIYGDPACGQLWKTTTLDPANPSAIASECWASGYHGTYGLAEDSIGELYIIRGPSSQIDCIHNGDGCFWHGTALFLDGFESGDTGAWN